MKIYKLDIDTSKPIRKVVQMQQNSTGALSVDVSNDGKYIRNLSCAMYEDGNEISAIAEGDDSFGYKLTVGETPHTVKITAKSTPIESQARYVVSIGSGRNTTVFLNQLILPAGTYNQDEFYGIADQFGDKYGQTVFWYVNSQNLSSTNFGYICLTPWQKERPVYFMDSNQHILPADMLISASSEISVGKSQMIKQQGTVLSSITYPAVGYWTDYSLDTVIKPSTNAACYAEYDIQEPTPDPEPEPTPDPEPEPTPDSEEPVEP